MDRFGSFDRDQDQDAVSATDAGVEAPPAIGTDERRMHVRAYNHWVSLLDGRAYPSIEDLEPENLTDFGPHSVLLDFSAGAGSPGISYLGGALRTECDLPENIESVADVPSRSLLSRLTDHYLQIIANRAPIGFEAEFVNHRGNNTMYRGILMPFSSDDDTIDFIYGVINWKEVADAALSTDITDAVDKVLQSAAPRPSTPVAVWADGPSANIAESAHGDAHDDDDDALDLAAFESDGTEELADWLAAARDFADVSKQAEGRSRQALYRALGQAYDFAQVADARQDDYVQLLDDSGIKPQDRAPMTPVVKLVFGIDYDKTRLAEYATALTHGRRQNIASGEFTAYLEKFAGGLKGVVAAERASRRPERAGDEEFVVLIARRLDGDHVAVIGCAQHDEAMIDRALKSIGG
jgi:hypothetical protein